LTLLPRARWQTLLNLEVIQQRNKPKEPPKPVEQAPFFLPTLPGVEPRFAVDPSGDHNKTAKSTKRLHKAVAESDSIFYQKLVADDAEGDYENLFGYMKTLSPAAIDLELRSLVSLDGLRLFLNALTRRLISHRDFEAVQAFLNVFLCMQADVIVENAELREDLVKLKDIQQRESGRVLELIASSLGTLGFVRDN